MIHSVIFVVFLIGFILLVNWLHLRFHPFRALGSFRISKPTHVDFEAGNGRIESVSYQGTIAVTIAGKELHIKEAAIPFFPRYWRFPSEWLRSADDSKWSHALLPPDRRVRMLVSIHRMKAPSGAA